jgi:hypothetical protein
MCVYQWFDIKMCVEVWAGGKCEEKPVDIYI